MIPFKLGKFVTLDFFTRNIDPSGLISLGPIYLLHKHKGKRKRKMEEYVLQTWIHLLQLK
jgi:hypothetical protein